MSERRSNLSMGLPQFETFLEGLSVPNNCVLNKPLFKKMFQEHANLDAKDKKALKEDVDKIRWLYTLKPSTINIAPYIDDLRDYGELAVLQVEISNTKSAERIGHLINRAIPYPLVVLFVFTEIKEEIQTSEHEERNLTNEKLAICLADKRINKADKEKWVIEELQLSPWLCLNNITKCERNFLNSLTFSSLSHRNLWYFYQAFMARVQALQCAGISGRFHLASGELAEQDQEMHRENQRNHLQHYRQIEQDIKKLRAQIKQAEFSQQIVLNTQIKQQEQRLKQIAETL